MRAVILCNGDAPPPELLRSESKDAELVICVDGALKYCKNERFDLFVGDMDSLDGLTAPESVETIRLTPEKDETDSQIALMAAIERGCREIVFLGALGGRLDHTLGNIQLLVLAAKNGAQAVMKDGKTTVWAACKTLELTGEMGDTLSVIPMGINTRIRALSGLKYPLFDTLLDLGKPLCVSNEFIQKNAVVDVADGWAIVIKTKKV